MSCAIAQWHARAGPISSYMADRSPSSGFGLLFLTSDSDWFRHCRVRIRIGFAGPGSDSDRFRRARFGFGSDSAPRNRVRFGFGNACRFNCLLVIIIASGRHAFIIIKLNAGSNCQKLMSPLQRQLFIITLTLTLTEHARREKVSFVHFINDALHSVWLFACCAYVALTGISVFESLSTVLSDVSVRGVV